MSTAPVLEGIHHLKLPVSDTHEGVHRTPVGWVLLGVQDPDGHAVRFYTVPLEWPPQF